MIEPTEIPAGKYYTVAQIAEMQDVMVRTVQQWIDKGWLAALRVAGLGYIIHEQDLKSFLAAPRPQRGPRTGSHRKK